MRGGAGGGRDSEEAATAAAAAARASGGRSSDRWRGRCSVCARDERSACAERVKARASGGGCEKLVRLGRDDGLRAVHLQQPLVLLLLLEEILEGSWRRHRAAGTLRGTGISRRPLDEPCENSVPSGPPEGSAAPGGSLRARDGRGSSEDHEGAGDPGEVGGDPLEVFYRILEGGKKRGVRGPATRSAFWGCRACKAARDEAAKKARETRRRNGERRDWDDWKHEDSAPPQAYSRGGKETGNEGPRHEKCVLGMQSVQGG